jgi:hypothetical protein
VFYRIEAEEPIEDGVLHRETRGWRSLAHRTLRATLRDLDLAKSAEASRGQRTQPRLKVV